MAVRGKNTRGKNKQTTYRAAKGEGEPNEEKRQMSGYKYTRA